MFAPLRPAADQMYDTQRDDPPHVKLPEKVRMSADPTMTAAASEYFAAAKLRIKSWMGRLLIEAKIHKRRC
jgi:hypothetical protein